MKSKYWRKCSDKSSDEYALFLEDTDSLMEICIYPSGDCYIKSGFVDILEFIAMMQEAHELARQHFGEQWGTQE